MRYKMTFTAVYSKKTGRILEEIWEPLQRLFWPLPWMKLPGEPKFETSEELGAWFDKHYPGKKIDYCYYGKSRSKD